MAKIPQTKPLLPKAPFSPPRAGGGGSVSRTFPASEKVAGSELCGVGYGGGLTLPGVRVRPPEDDFFFREAPETKAGAAGPQIRPIFGRFGAKTPETGLKSGTKKRGF